MRTRIAAFTLAASLLAVGCGGSSSPPRNHDPADLGRGNDPAGPDGADGGTDAAPPPGDDLGTPDSYPAAHTCSPDGWCWWSPGPDGNPKNAGWAAAPDDVWLAGEYGALDHWDGHQWRSYRRPELGNLQWSALWGSAANDVWAAGMSGRGADHNGLHWDGHAWSEVNMPDWIDRLTGSASDDIWGLSYLANWHWDGHVWSQFRSEQEGLFRTIVARGRDDVWATADAGGVFHYDGSRWSEVADGLDHTIAYDAVWTAGNDLWLTGLTNGQRRMVHGDGQRFAEVAPPPPELVTLRQRWGSGPDDIWILSDDFQIAHWDGHQWSPQLFDRAPEFTALVGSGRGDLWAAGRGDSLAHWNGSGWTFASPGAPSDSTVGRAWGSSVDDLYVSLNTGFGVPAMHWDGHAWSPVQLPGAATRVSALWGSAADDVWVGACNENDECALLRWDGHSWNKQLDGTEVVALWGLGRNDVWLVDQSDTPRHFDGTRWSPADVAADAAFKGTRFWGRAANDVWAAADTGRWHWDGQRWSRVDSGNYTDVSSIAPDNVWVLRFHDVLHGNGEKLELVHTSTQIGGGLSSIFAASDSDVYVCGYGCEHFDGTTWKRVDFGGLFFDVFGARPDQLWAFGPYGIARRH